MNLEIGRGESARSALIVAMETRKEAIAQTLLDHGASIPPTSTWSKRAGNKDLKFAGVREVLNNEKRSSNS